MIAILISYKWIGITKYYIYLQQFSVCLLHTLPQDYGDKVALMVYWQGWGGFLIFSFNYKGSFLALAAT